MQKHCSECENVMVLCTLGCEEAMMRSKLPQHMKLHCIFRITTCEYCSIQLEYIIYQVIYLSCVDY